MKRVFLGIDLPQEIKNKIEKLKKEHRLERLPIKLVEPENSHIAIKFLDKLTDEQINQIKQIVGEIIKDVQAFEVQIKNSLIFPNLKMPKVLTLKVIGHQLEKVGQTIIWQLEQLPFIEQENRPYTPHITLGRINGQLSPLEKEKIAAIQFNEKFVVEKIQLFESQLNSTGPVYTIIKSFHLN